LIFCAVGVVIVMVAGLLALSQVRDDFIKATDVIGSLWEEQQIAALRADEFGDILLTIRECDHVQALGGLKKWLALKREVTTDAEVLRWLDAVEEKIVPALAWDLHGSGRTGPRRTVVKDAMQALILMTADQLDYFEETARHSTEEVETAATQIMTAGHTSLTKWMWVLLFTTMAVLAVILAAGTVAARRMARN